MQGRTKKIAYAGIAAAIGAVCIVLTQILPLRISLLMFAAVCYYIAFDKGGYLFGLLSVAASLLIGFFVFGLSSGFLLTAIVFAPYALLAYAIRKLYYRKPLMALLRVAILIVFANLALMFVFFLSKYIAFDLSLAVEVLHGYAVLAIVISVLFVIFDFLFLQLSLRLCKLIR